jgi:hypothetical protein
MGNKSSVALLSIYDDILSHRISLGNIHGDETLQQLENILDCVDSYSGDFSNLNSKDTKLLASVASLLANEFGRDGSASSPVVVKACKLKAMASIYRLLCIPIVSRNALEGCTAGLVNCIDISNLELSSLAISCICTGLVSVDDESFKLSICLQLEKIGCYEKLLLIIDKVAYFKMKLVNGSLLYNLLIILEHFVWLLGEPSLQPSSALTSSSLKLFQTRVVAKIVKHLNALFELTRHSESPVRFAVTMLLIQILNGQERKLCSLIQVTTLFLKCYRCVVISHYYCYCK